MQEPQCSGPSTPARGRDGVGFAPAHGRTRAANGVPLRDGRWGERVHHARGGRCRGLWRGDGDEPQLLLHGRATGVPPPKHPGSPRSSTRLLSPSTRLVRHRPSSRGVAAHSTCTGPAGIRMCHLTVTSVVTRPALIQTAGQHCTLIQRASTPAAAADCAGGLRDSHGELPAIAHGAGGAPREGKGARH